MGPALESHLLRDVVVHLQNEQPLLADLAVEPARADTVVICRNLRTMNGKKQDFVDRSIPRSSFPDRLRSSSSPPVVRSGSRGERDRPD